MMVRIAGLAVALMLACAPAQAQRVLFGGKANSGEIARAAQGSEAARFGFDGPTPLPHARGVQGKEPFYFWLDLAPGNYRVTVTLGGPAASRTTVKAELRRLMLSAVAVPAGGTRRLSFIVNVRTPTIAGGGTVRLKAPRETTQEAAAWDPRLTLEFNGLRPAVRSVQVEPLRVPTIYLLGDSTVTDQSGEPYASWGQMLTAMFRPTIAIANHGESGESVAASNDRGRFAKIIGEIQPGDLFVVQFGHNDMKDKQRDPQAPAKYRDGLIAWARAVQDKGATAVIVTPMNRHRFVEGRVINTLEEYPQMARDAAQASGARLIDLNALSKTLYEAFGEQASLELFKHEAGGTNRDATHHSPFGAWELARVIAAELARVDVIAARAVKPEFRRFDPSKPDRFADFHVPPSPTLLTMRPLGDDAYKPVKN
ncbi:rhamnogalacturonan acetylesterase [Sphingomonas sp.]|jgi:lysophospholipase L1-like esterase|uniref:rhamnogalacturonan acetylesterase n=1 Tax=Sphingomonas sp. TaxID=28214 RepID=UPI002ED78A45